MNRSGVPLDGDKHAAFAAEVAGTNRRRMLVLFPLLIVGHAIHIAIFHVTPAERAMLAPRIVEWRVVERQRA